MCGCVGPVKTWCAAARALLGRSVPVVAVLRSTNKMHEAYSLVDIGHSHVLSKFCAGSEIYPVVLTTPYPFG